MRARPLHRGLRFENLEARRLLTVDLRITEFMASNGGSLLDSFGESSDWFEIHNGGTSVADMSQYYATDDAGDLTKWRFPAVNLAPGGLLVVFASGRDTVLPNGEIHTNFALSQSGEYFGLVSVDDATVVHDYAPAYPPQFEDISYGLKMFTSGSQQTLLASGVPSRAIVPTTGGLGTTWTQTTFDDSAWPFVGNTGVGYENFPENYAQLIGNPVSTAISTFYTRIPFQLNSLGGLGQLTLRMKYDDGFVAYLNGVKIASANAPEVPLFDSEATANHPDAQAVVFQDFNVSSGISALRVGTNILAIHGMNVDPNSSDMLILPELVGQPSGVVLPVETGFMDLPSPGSANNQTFAGFVAPVDFSLPHGFYDTAQVVSLSTVTSGAVIAYTFDGSEPTVDANFNVTNGVIYTAPLQVNASRVIRAAAFAPTLRASRAVTQSYLFVNDIVQQSQATTVAAGFPDVPVNGQDIDYGMDPDILALYGSQAVRDSLRSLSTFVITTDVDNLFDATTGIYVNAQNGGREWERESSIELIEPDGTDGFQLNAGLRIRGGYSRGDFNPKHGFRMYFRGEYGAGKLNYPLFGDEGVAEFDVLDLRTDQNYSWASSGDSQNSLVREVFSRDAQRDMESPYTRSRYHHLYLNGVYWGIYQTQERVEDFYGESYLGGTKEDYDVVKSGLRETGGPTEISDGNDAAWQQLFQSAQALADNPTTNANNYWTMQGLNPDGTRNPAYPVLVDVDNLIDYMSVIFFTGNSDSGISAFLGNNVANNWFGIRNRINPNQGFLFFQHDAEHSLGVNGTLTIDRTGPFNQGNQSNYSYFNPQYLHQDLMAHPEYKIRFGDRIHKHMFNGGALTQADNLARLNQRVTEVDPAIIAESARWGDSKIEPPRNKSHWLNEINWIRNTYFPQRGNTVLGQLRADALYPTVTAPTFNQFGGTIPPNFDITLNSGGTLIYYTTDGSDPRSIGGGISPTAKNYASPGNNPIRLTQDATIKARTRSGLTWSALVEASFNLQAVPATAANFRVTEIQYNPLPPTVAELAQVPGITNSDFEYLELQNISNGPIALNNLQFTTGITFNFPGMTIQAGERVLVVKNHAAFQARYGASGPRIAGEYGLSSELSNGGELISLHDALGTPIQSFSYGDDDNWPTLPDGQGPSLEVAQLAGNYNDPLNWLPSTQPNGSPGTDGRPVPSPSRLRVTELHYNPVGNATAEFIELQNLSPAPLSLAGYRFVEGITFSFAGSPIQTLAPGERVLVAASLSVFQTVYGAGLPVAGQFSTGSLANGGERIILFDAMNRVVHDFVFDDAAPFPTSPDGGGPSLEVINPQADYSAGANWRASGGSGGSPGSGPVYGDFDQDGRLDCDDLTLLSAAIQGGTHPAAFDVNADGSVNAADLQVWTTSLLGTLPGDANLDGIVDGSDFNIWNSHKFTTGTTWCTGDFSGDGVSDGSDFNIWNSNKFTGVFDRSVVSPPSVHPSKRSSIGQGAMTRRGKAVEALFASIYSEEEAT